MKEWGTTSRWDGLSFRINFPLVQRSATKLSTPNRNTPTISKIFLKLRTVKISVRSIPPLTSTILSVVVDEWTELAAPLADVGVYVNLLENPERFTGYAGPPAHRVWKAIKEENCFGSGIEEMCLEKRIFYRLMSGLQASISTHIARQYLHSSGEWGVNLPLYWNAVGNHQDRVDNLYLAFLFLLRATMKARQVLLHYPYDTGNYTDDKRVKELMTRFFSNQQFSVVSKEYSPVLYGYSQNSALSGDSFSQVS